MLSRGLLTVAIWLFALVSCALFARETMLGPIVFVIDRGEKGIHLGDVLACVGFPGWAFAVTRSFWLPERRERGAVRR